MTGGEPPRRPGGNHTLNGIYYFSGTGSNDGYGKDDHVLVTDAFEKHVTRTWMPSRDRSNVRVLTWTASSISMSLSVCLLPTVSPRPPAKHGSMHAESNVMCIGSAPGLSEEQCLPRKAGALRPHREDSAGFSC
jgi:hypothetical protein